MTAKQQKRACPHCGSRQLTKLISRIAPVSRDNGFDSDGFGEDEDLGDYDELDD
jgi:hypothetical protein